MKKGFTLIEILIVMALSAILLDVIYNIYQKNNDSYGIINTKSDLYKHNLQALDNIRLDIKKSHTVIRNYDIFSSDANSIILEIPRLDVTNIPIPNSYYYVVYTGNTTTNELTRYEYTGGVPTSKIISSNYDLATFTYKDNLGNTLNLSNIETSCQVKIELTLEDQYRSQTYHSYLSSNETMRNK